MATENLKTKELSPVAQQIVKRAGAKIIVPNMVDETTVRYGFFGWEKALERFITRLSVISYLARLLK